MNIRTTSGVGERASFNDMGNKKSLLCVAPFNNPHIIPFYEEVEKYGLFDTTVVSLEPTTEARLDLGWQEMGRATRHLQPWRSWRDRIRFYSCLWTADLVIFPGFFSTSALPFYHLIRRLTLRPVILWSEPFLNHPRSLNESKLKRAARKILLAPFNTAKYHFLAMGAGAEVDYRLLGMHRWSYRQFLYSVTPRVSPRTKRNTDDTRQILYVGSLIHRKGVDLLIQAIHHMLPLRIPIKLTIVGNGPEKTHLHECVEKLGMSSFVEFVGVVRMDECYDIMENQDVLVLPSRFDGWGAVVNEAMECALAVIVSDQVGSRRPLIKTGLNGYVFRSGSVSDLHEKLVLTVQHRETLKKMKLASEKRIRAFTPEALAEPFSRFCECLLSEKHFESDHDDVLISI